MKIKFLKNGNFKYNKTQIQENLRDLISTMGFKPSEDNMKIFRTYLGIEGGRKPLENESFNDYYKRTLKLFMKDMQKEAKRKLDEEGKKAIIDGKDVLHKFDNLMNSLAELHNDDVDKREKEAKEKEKEDKDKSPVNNKNAKDEKGFATNEKKELEVPKITQSSPKVEDYPQQNNNRPAKKVFQEAQFDESYGWTRYIEEDTDEKRKVEEYLRRQRQYQRLVIEHYASYTTNSFADFLLGFFKVKENDSPIQFCFAPSLCNDIHREKMLEMFNVPLTPDGKVKNYDDLKTNYKNVANYYLTDVNPTDDYSPSKEKITQALEEADTIVVEKIPNDKKYHKHLGLSDKNFDDLKTEMLFMNAQYSLKWIYAGTYDQPLDTIVVKDKDKGENVSKAYLAVNILKGLKEAYDQRNPFSKISHKEEKTQISQIEQFLIEKAGLSREFIDMELKDEFLRDKMSQCLVNESKEKVEQEKVVKKNGEIAKDSDVRKKSAEKSEVKQLDKNLDKAPEQMELSVAPISKKKKEE